MLIKYIKSVLWRVAKRLSYIKDARCLKVNSDMYNYKYMHLDSTASFLVETPFNLCNDVSVSD